MTHTELELCARFLGKPYFFGRHPNIESYTGIWITRPLEHDEENSDQLTDADLLLALLERAAEGLNRVELIGGAGWWEAILARKGHGSGPTPLAAMTAAVAKYMEAK